MSTITLSKPVAWGGEPTREVEMNLEGLTGHDLVAAEREFQAVNPGFAGVASLQVEYAMCLAARAVKRPVDDIKALPAGDVLRLTGAVNVFLFGADSAAAAK
ncbi:MAG: phage tail assembly protein [Deltaproteobacteria bacterium]|nr:phage tail assembly protein [Deltaproteobacteria bacterium]